jgi:hypothetical protein
MKGVGNVRTCCLLAMNAQVARPNGVPLHASAERR